jgi:hypothetical protein
VDEELRRYVDGLMAQIDAKFDAILEAVAGMSNDFRQTTAALQRRRDGEGHSGTDRA